MDLCSRIQIKKKGRRNVSSGFQILFFPNPMQYLLSNAKSLCPLVSMGSEAEWLGVRAPRQSPSELGMSSTPVWSNLQCAGPLRASREQP